MRVRLRNSSDAIGLERRVPLDPSAAVPACARGSRIERAGVDHRRRRLITAENDQQIADHSRLALLVELDNPMLIQTGQRELDHPNSTLDDPRTGCHDGVGLFATQHCLDNLRRVSQMADTDLHDLHAGDHDPFSYLGGEFVRDDIDRSAQRGASPKTTSWKARQPAEFYA